MNSTITRARGHEKYKAWLDVVGQCFSPLFPLREPLRFGPCASWTVEALYQGLKLFAIEDFSLIHPKLDFTPFLSGESEMIHVPAAMQVSKDLREHILFRLLKSGRKYNGKKNHYFGRMDSGRRNWAWTETWRHPILDVSVDRQQFNEDILVRSLHSLFHENETAVAQLRRFWRKGRYFITPDMRLAHGHLKYLEEYVDASGSSCSGA